MDKAELLRLIRGDEELRGAIVGLVLDSMRYGHLREAIATEISTEIATAPIKGIIE